MKKLIISLSLCTIGLTSTSQTVTYDFTSDPLTSGWTNFNSAGVGPSVGFTHSAVNQNINYNISTTTGTHILHRPTPYTLGNQFSVSFKIRTGNQQNTFFPLLLTPNEVPSPHNHPWRLNPNMGIGALQNIDLLGVAIVNGEVRLVNRDGSSAFGITPYSVPFTLLLNTDYWIRLERTCSNSLNLTVFSNESLTTIVRDETFTIPNLDAMNHLYIANCNGNSTTLLRGILDDYIIDQPINTCCTPNQINGDNVICNTESTSFFSADISGDIQNANWSISPAGPTFTQNTSNPYTLTVTDWNQPGTYTITFVWTCNCVTTTLTKVVNVQNPINDIDYVSLSSSCTELPNTHGFNTFANGTNPTIVRNWAVYLAANTNQGDYSTIGQPIATYGNVNSLSINSLPNTNAYIIKCYHYYTDGVCPIEIVNRKSICMSFKSLDTKEINYPVIYPNPTEDEININLPTHNTINQLDIVDINGKVIMFQKISAFDKSVSVNLERLIDGVYFIVYRGDNNFVPEKIIKQ